MKNWKTTLIGVLGAMLVAGAEALGLPHAVATLLIAGVLAALGLASKDSNVTGGTVQQ